MTDRAYDVVVFGATGFTGRLTAEYLAKNAPADVRWAIAGRDPRKLEELRADLRTRFPETCGGERIGIVRASVDDDASLLAMARATKVVASTVGPFALYGEPVVRACIEAGTSYADITGEPAFVDGILERYGERAQQAKVRIVNCCGFDSIPADLGAYFTMKQLPASGPARIEGFVRARGAYSGGTWQSAIHAMGNLRRELRRRKQRARPANGSGRRARSTPLKIRYERSLGAWVCPMPTIDPQVVLRSARAVEGYGPDFRYGHYVCVRSGAKLVTGGLGLAAVVALAQVKPTRKWLLSMKKPGEGPPPEERAKHWFKVRFFGEAGGKRVVTEVSGGDAGYDETSKMLAESAMCLAKDGAKLPERYGVLTPAAAMDDALLERLQRAGLRFEVLES